MTKQHNEGAAKYNGVKSVPTPVDNKKTVKVRGTGAAVKGTMATSKMG